MNSHKPYVLSLDSGTTSARAIIFDHKGQPVAASQMPVRQTFPSDGWVEQDPLELFEAQKKCLSLVFDKSGLPLQSILSLGITNQRETTIVWEKTSGKPVYPAIVWQDRRTARYCEELHLNGLEPWIHEKTGLRLDPYFSASKIRWILENVPGAKEKAQRGELAFGTVDSWLIWNLTGGVHITDVTNASRTLLMNIRSLRWDEELLDLFEIPPSMLPAIVPSCGEIAWTTPEGAGGIWMIGGVAGDQQAATFGQACFVPGMAKNTYGTGGFLLMNTGEAPRLSRHRLLSTVLPALGFKVPNYALEGSVFVAGAVVQWLRDSLSLFEHSSDVEALAASVADNGGVYMVPAFSGLGAPHWDPHARGLIVGLTRASNKGHLARAALESIAFQCNDVLRAMSRDAETELTELRVDGGACGNDLLMQFQADISGVPVIRPVVTETTALGAAYLAGLGCGMWDDPEQIRRLWRASRVFEPRMSEDERTYLTEQWGRALARSKGWEQ